MLRRRDTRFASGVLLRFLPCLAPFVALALASIRGPASRGLVGIWLAISRAIAVLSGPSFAGPCLRRRSTLRALWISLFVVALLGIGAAPASAQGIGVRAGASGDPDQFYAGFHYESEELVDRLRFRPNIELGVGDNVTLVALNIEFAYRFPLNKSLW